MVCALLGRTIPWRLWVKRRDSDLSSTMPSLLMPPSAARIQANTIGLQGVTKPNPPGGILIPSYLGMLAMHKGLGLGRKPKFLIRQPVEPEESGNT